MAEKYRIDKPCVDCPFNDSGPGQHLRESLGEGRMDEIYNNLQSDGHFMCHKTTDETGDGSNLICAGSIVWQEAEGFGASQYLRVCERLEVIRLLAH